MAIDLLANSKLQEKFYWTGGTLLAHHYLQHRKSEDLDFFTEKEFSFNEINQWINKYKAKSGITKTEYRKIYDRWEFLFKNKNKRFRIEFVYYNKSRKSLAKRKKLMGVYIDSLEDIAANKTFALIDRNEPKDLFDIYFLIKKGKFTPKKLLYLANNKFSSQFPLDLLYSEIFAKLKYLDKLEPLMIQQTRRERKKIIMEIKEYFKSISNKYLNKYISE